MLFLNLENQLLLITILAFSAYILINALAVRHQSSSLRAFGLAFSLPFFLTVKAFLIAPYRLDESEAFLFAGHFLLILLCTFVLLLRDESDSLKVFFVLPFVLILIGLLLPGFSIYDRLFVFFTVVDFALILINLAFVIQGLLQKESKRFPAFAGLLFISLSLGFWLLFRRFSLESLFPMVAGYISCEVYIYQNSLGKFFKEYLRESEELKRINASIQLEVIRRVEGIEQSNRKLLEKSKTDSMTGLYVNSAIVSSLGSLLERTPQTVISLLMMDIDQFKQINDSMGHQIGDRCIKTLSNLAQSSFRKDDILGRYGGDEFLVILPATPPVKAFLIADRFRQLVQSRSTPTITISIGIASYPADGKSSNELIEAADKALYGSKENGRNQVTLFSSLKN